MHEAKTHFSQIVERALSGELVVIAKNGKPVLTLSPLPTAAAARVPGLSRGKAIPSEDFDEPLAPSILREFE